jgi:hypothetical protein
MTAEGLVGPTPAARLSGSLERSVDAWAHDLESATF